MARGKHGKSSEHRATTRVVEAEDKARNAEIRANRLGNVLAERDAEIERLKDAVTQARIENTKPGTYTDADVALMRSEYQAKHRAAIREGFIFLHKKGAPAFLPMGHIAEMATAFDCEPADFLAGVETRVRETKRLTAAKVRYIDEAMKQEKRA